MTTPEFKEFNKITRFWEQELVVTEKIDGTNGLIHVDAEGNIQAGSRSRWITPEQDNYGFARWAQENKEELKKLGEGYHYGEWWGKGIQHGYGMDKKVFSLFNTHRWQDESVRPTCCDVVPVVFKGFMKEFVAEFPNHTEVPKLSLAAKKYGKESPFVEGLMLYFTAGNFYMKHVVKPGRKNG